MQNTHDDEDCPRCPRCDGCMTGCLPLGDPPLVNLTCEDCGHRWRGTVAEYLKAYRVRQRRRAAAAKRA